MNSVTCLVGGLCMTDNSCQLLHNRSQYYHVPTAECTVNSGQSQTFDALGARSTCLSISHPPQSLTLPSPLTASVTVYLCTTVCHYLPIAVLQCWYCSIQHSCKPWMMQGTSPLKI